MPKSKAIKTLTDLEDRLTQIKTPAELFNGDIDGTLKKLLAMCHPDRNPNNDLAAKLFIQVQQLAEEAKQPAVVIKSPKRSYTLLQRKYVGDVSDVYIAESGKVEYLVKISRIPGAEKLLDRERQVLTELHTAAKDDTYRCYFPLLVDSFPAHDRFKRRVNVFTYDPEWVSLMEVLTKYKDGLDSKHIIWILKRIFTALGFISRQEIIHGAITPDHILIRPRDHAVQLVGWGQSVKPGTVLTSVPVLWKGLYPQEALEKKPARSGADVVLTASALIGASKMPTKLTSFIHGTRCKGQWCRDVDAWELVNELAELAKALYGKPKFVPLEM